MKFNQVILLFFTVSILTGCSTQVTKNYGTDNSYIYEKMITVDNINYRVKTYGYGDITVIFESGIALPLETWDSIDSAVSDFAKVFLYAINSPWMFIRKGH